MNSYVHECVCTWMVVEAYVYIHEYSYIQTCVYTYTYIYNVHICKIDIFLIATNQPFTILGWLHGAYCEYECTEVHM